MILYYFSKIQVGDTFRSQDFKGKNHLAYAFDVEWEFRLANTCYS